MKTHQDPRHLKRIKIIAQLFAESFQSGSDIPINSLTSPLKKLLPKIDPVIEESAPQFPINQIAKIDAAILRLSIYELLYEKKEPFKVIIDEAIEMAKEFGGEKSPAFVNGVLGNVLKKLRPKN